MRYYKGVKYPLMSSVGFNSVVFPLKDHLHGEYRLNYATSGFITGLVVSPPMYFVDTYTIRSQTNQKVSLSMFRGSKGFGSTMLRESVRLVHTLAVITNVKNTKFVCITRIGRII